ncbi:MAG: insulinase family protein [Candidatus Dojkabacteria bacterium]|nr:insulinase family protein [Candidatus Dojkabacteria bacterium]
MQKDSTNSPLVETYKLDNGLDVILVDLNNTFTITLLTLIKAGSKYETLDNNGISHFIEHMVFKGTKNFPSELEISINLDLLGGNFNGFTSKEYTGFYIKSSVDRFSDALFLLSDLIKNPLFLEDSIESEKLVILQEIDMYLDEPFDIVSNNLNQLIFGNNSLGMDILGTKESIQKITARDILLEFLRKFYSPINSVFVVAGNIQKYGIDKLKNDIRRYFLDWQSLSFEKSSKVEYIPKQQKSFEIVTKCKDNNQTKLSLGFRTFSYFDDRIYALALLDNVLGGSMSSRLFNELRIKRGLCYLVDTTTALYSEDGCFITLMDIKNDLDSIYSAVRIILEQFLDISNNGVKSEELNKVKQMIKTKQLINLESSMYLASLFAEYKLLKNVILNIPDYIQRFQDVSNDEIKSLAKEVFRKDNLNISVLSPLSDSDIVSTIDKAVNSVF